MKYSVIYSASLFCSLLAAAHSTTAPSHGKRFQKKRAILPGIGDDSNDNGGGFNPDLHIGPVFPITLPNGVVIGGPSSSSPTSTSTHTSSSSAPPEVTVTSEVTSTVTVTSSNTDGPSSGSTSSKPTSSSAITSVLPATSTSLPVDPTDPPSGSPSGSVPTATSTSSSGGGILDPITSLVSSILDPPPPTSSTPTATADPTAPSSAPGSTITPPPSTSSSSSGGGILDPITSIVSSILDPPPPSSSPSGPTSEPSSQPPSSEPTNPPTDGPSSVPSSVPTSDPPSSTPTDGPSSVPPSSSPTITISFPSTGPSTSVTDSASASITDAPTVTATTTISVNSDLSFVLTETTLAFTSVPLTTSLATTLSDPDSNPTSLADSEPTPATTLSVAPLPTGIPARIYPKNTLDLKSIDMKKWTLISVLFNQELNWGFVVTSPISSSQIFAYMPNIISNALGIDASQVQTFALQVYIPAMYKSPADSALLGTMYLAFIPTDRINDLAALIKAKSSIFYTGLSDPVAKALADHVDSGFSIKTVSNPNSGSNNSGVGDIDGASNSSGGSNKSRQDAIIGVVSALGAIALLVLGFLVYRSVQRKREMAHRRLSDPPEMTEEERDRMGFRPDGREFDRDSLGGQRRRSFYFAEDSLRGWEYQQQQQQQQMAQQAGPSASYSYLQDREGAQGMSRRNVGPVLVPGAISAPILRENTMNW